MGLIIFLLVFPSIYFGMHYFIFHRLCQGLEIVGTERSIIGGIMFFAGLSFIAGAFMIRKFDSVLLFKFGSVWIGVLSIAFTIFLVRELLVLALPGHQWWLTVISLGLTVILSGYGYYNASGKPYFHEIQVPVKNLPVKLHGFKIVQMSDLHLTRFHSIKWLKRLIKVSNGTHPDLVVITGDLIDDSKDGLYDQIKALKKIKSRYGVYAIPGNHEHYAGMDEFRKTADASGMKVLFNESVTIAGKLDLVGIDDIGGNSYPSYSTILNRLIESGNGENPKILLSHRPHSFDAAVLAGFDLAVAGHIHAGQIPPISLLVGLSTDYPHGLYRKGETTLYTTSGTATWGPPMRIGSRSEVVLFTLEPLAEEGN
jgi:hypothetical protein